VTVTCEEDPSLSWQRKCVGTRWEGELGTCPGSYATGAVNQPPGPLPIGKHVIINYSSLYRMYIFSAFVNLLECRGNYSATSNNMKLVRSPFVGGLLHLV